MGRVTTSITHIGGVKTLLITTHEPLSTLWGLGEVYLEGRGT